MNANRGHCIALEELCNGTSDKHLFGDEQKYLTIDCYQALVQALERNCWVSI